MKKKVEECLEFQIVEVDDGALEQVLGGVHDGCINEKDCRGSDNSQCTNRELCLVGCGPTVVT